MSNSFVGVVYSKIIDDVINLCRAPFEEEGAQPNVLDDFKKEWQNKISLRKVATMPWDPPSVPATQNPNSVPPTRPQPYSAPVPAPAPTNNETKIKTEPGTSYDLQNLSTPQSTSYASSNTQLAYANASQQLREQFGEKASASIQQINERAQEASSTPHGQKRPLPAGSPTQENSDSKRRVTEYNNSVQVQTQAKLQQLNNTQSRQANVGAAQTDGASDWKSMIAERMSIPAEDIHAADRSIMELVRTQWRAEEGNGLMSPASRFDTSTFANQRSSRFVTSGQFPAQNDGIDDDDDADIKDDPDEDGDADAINSDLDDDEEEQVDDDDDDDPQQLIVCTYEKVARVKNKWKCTLRDGILITGGQEYVFNKATGEFDW